MKKITVESSIGTGQPVDVEVGPKKTVRQVLEEVANENLVGASTLNLIDGNRILDPAKTLKQEGITEGMTIKVMPKNPHGGTQGVTVVSPQLARRLRAELQRVREKDLPIQPRTPLEWQGILQAEGNWSGQKWPFKVELPRTYPAKPPVIVIQARPQPWHPNISPRGFVCLNHLQDAWNPTMNLATVYEDLRWLTRNPNWHHPNNPFAQRLPAGPVPRQASVWDRLAAWLS